MPSRSFYFLRHGETDWNVAGRLQGHTDIPLNDNGRAQARRCIDVLKAIGIDRIVTSPLSRAFETASIISLALNKPLHTQDGIREKSFGLFEGKSGPEIEDIKKAFLDQTIIEPETGYVCPPQGEIYAEFSARVISSIREILDQYPNETILIVSHGGVYSGLCRHLLGQKTPERSPNAQPFHFKRDGSTWTLEKIS